MAREFAREFCNSKAWRDCADAYARSKGMLCERCLAKGIIVPGKIVHHKRHLTPQNINDPSVTLAWENLEYLCQDCHNAEHNAGARRYWISADGSVAPKRRDSPPVGPKK